VQSMTPGTKLDSRTELFEFHVFYLFLIFANVQRRNQPLQRLNNATHAHLLSYGRFTCCHCCLSSWPAKTNDRSAILAEYWFLLVAGFVLIHISRMRKPLQKWEGKAATLLCWWRHLLYVSTSTLNVVYF